MHQPARTQYAARIERKVIPFYVIEGISSHAVALMLSSIYFYTTGRFHWDARRNFLLATALGVVYVLAALCSHRISVRLGRRRTLVFLYVAMSAAAACGAAAADSPRVVVPVLIAYSALSAVSWPALESLVSTGAGAGELSRRLGIYNCVWSGAGALTYAGAGTLLKYWPVGTFVLPASWHLAMAGYIVHLARRDAAIEETGDETAHGAPEPELLRARTLALWMSRIGLPATFVVISSLIATMPTLPLIERLDPTARTVVGSAWMAARWTGFLLLGVTVWWHTRPRALLAAAVLLLVGFVAVTLRPQWLPGAPAVATGPWIAWMVGWQVVLGLGLALIYSASLYFGMVLSDGSTEHGGYHEALIGLGTVIGPGAGAVAEQFGGGDPLWGVLAVAVVLAASVAACGFVAARRGDTSSAAAEPVLR